MKQDEYGDAEVDYFKMMLKHNPWSISLDLTCEFFGCEQDDLLEMLDERGVEDEY